MARKVLSPPSQQVTCFGCGEVGHIKPNCPKWKKDWNKEKNKKIMLVERKGEVADTKNGRENLKEFRWFMSVAKVSSMEDRHKEVALPADCPFMEGEMVVLRGFPDSWTTCPMVELFLDSSLVKGQVKVAVVKELPVKVVTLIPYLGMVCAGRLICWRMGERVALFSR